MATFDNKLESKLIYKGAYRLEAAPVGAAQLSAYFQIDGFRSASSIERANERFFRTGDPALTEFDDAVIIARPGEVYDALM